MRSRAVKLFAIVTAGSLLLAACGDDDDETTASDTTQVDVADDAETVTVTAVDYAFNGLPKTVSVGTRLEFENVSDKELHELVAIRLNDDEERSVAELVKLPEEEAQSAFAPGPPAMVLLAPPGETGNAVVGDGTLSDPGRYGIVCFIPTGADPDEFMKAAQEAAESGAEGPPDVAGGPPHVVRGMFAELTVE